MVTVNKPLLDELRQKGKVSQGHKNFDFDMTKLAPADTQIFVLSPEVALAAETLIRSKSFRMPDVTELRFPYPSMAIEVPLTKEIQDLRLKTHPDGLEDGMYPVERIGVYLQSNHEEGWVNCAPYWGYQNKALVEPPVFTYTIGKDDLPFPSVGVRSPANHDDVKFFKVIPSPCVLDAYQRHNVPPHLVGKLYEGEQTDKLLAESVGELPTLLFACTVLLNCKSGVGKTKIAARTPPKGLKLGGKKQKAYSASAYTLLYLEEAESVTPDGVISRRTDISAHYVRGHFKQRKSGIYWWNSFVRGKGEPRKREAYLVEETA